MGRICINLSLMRFNCKETKFILMYIYTYICIQVHIHTAKLTQSPLHACLHIQRMSASASGSTIWKALCVRCFLTLNLPLRELFNWSLSSNSGWATGGGGGVSPLLTKTHLRRRDGEVTMGRWLSLQVEVVLSTRQC